MILQDNVIKEYLKNVYFITGTPCGGKTTISRELAKRHIFFKEHGVISTSLGLGT